MSEQTTNPSRLYITIALLSIVILILIGLQLGHKCKPNYASLTRGDSLNITLSVVNQYEAFCAASDTISIRYIDPNYEVHNKTFNNQDSASDFACKMLSKGYIVKKSIEQTRMPEYFDFSIWTRTEGILYQLKQIKKAIKDIRDSQ